jgi:hypothetical protein
MSVFCRLDRRWKTRRRDDLAGTVHTLSKEGWRCSVFRVRSSEPRFNQMPVRVVPSTRIFETGSCSTSQQACQSACTPLEFGSKRKVKLLKAERASSSELDRWYTIYPDDIELSGLTASASSQPGCPQGEDGQHWTINDQRNLNCVYEPPEHGRQWILPPVDTEMKSDVDPRVRGLERCEYERRTPQLAVIGKAKKHI